jgi:hypothetical protein
MIGVSRSCSTERRAALRSSANSPNVDEMKTRRRRSGVRICAVPMVLEESSVAI